MIDETSDNTAGAGACVTIIRVQSSQGAMQTGLSPVRFPSSREKSLLLSEAWGMSISGNFANSKESVRTPADDGFELAEL